MYFQKKIQNQNRLLPVRVVLVEGGGLRRVFLPRGVHILMTSYGGCPRL